MENPSIYAGRKPPQTFRTKEQRDFVSPAISSSFLLLVVRPGAPFVASLLLVAMPGAPSSFLFLVLLFVSPAVCVFQLPSVLIPVSELAGIASQVASVALRVVRVSVASVGHDLG